MTLNAQCHDHMYDPFSQHEYYQMFAFFNNNADPGMQTRRGNQAPVVEIMTPEPKQLADSEKVLKEARGKLNARRQQSLDPFKNWFAQCAKDIKVKPGLFEPEGLVAFFPFDGVDLEKNKSDHGVPEATTAILRDSPVKVANAKFKSGIRIEKNAYAEVPTSEISSTTKPFP